MNIEARVLAAIEERSEGITEKELVGQLGVSKEELARALGTLKENGVVEERRVGNMAMLYPLEAGGVRKVLIIEDDANINRLMRASLGKGYEVAQAYDGREGMRMVREFMPDLVLLDLMLPSLNGLDICQTIKADPQLRHIIVIIVSAADATRNRLQGMRFGADYYIKKPFEPMALRALVNIFLRKKGRRFDPLVDLPDEKRLSAEIEGMLGEADFELTNLRILHLKEFVEAYGEKEGRAVVRLLSQILQDKVREWDSERGFVGYIGEGEFIVGGRKNETSMVISEVEAEFEQVLPFIYQDKQQGVKLDIEDVFGDKKLADPKRLALRADVVPPRRIEEKREELTMKKAKEDIGSYTLEELRQLVGSSNLDVVITRSPKGVQISVSKGRKE